VRIQDSKDPQIDYQIRNLHSRPSDVLEVFEVAKWDGSRLPVNLYQVVKNTTNDRYTCDCPSAYRGACKHITMVKEFETRGRPATFPALENLEPL
jgi:hypothetical protein